MVSDRERKIKLQQRWIEIKFFLLFEEMYRTGKTPKDMEKLIETVAIFTKFDIDAVHNLVVKVLTDENFRPYKGELIILCAYNCVPVPYTLKVARTTRKHYYHMLKLYKKQRPLIYAALSPEEIEIMRTFLIGYYYLRRVGVPDAIRHGRTLAAIQELRDGSPDSESLRLS